MPEWLRDLRGALLLDTATFIRFRDRADVMLRGAVLIVVVALIAALPLFVRELANGLNPSSAQDQATQAAAQVEQSLQQAEPYLQNVPPQVVSSIRQGFEMGAQIASQIATAPALLPRPVGGFFRAVGHWLQRPVAGPAIPLAAASLATWLGYGIWVMLFSYWLGGRADLGRFFGTTALFAAPHLLDVFSWVPFVGWLFSLVAFFWGLAIYVKATAVSQEVHTDRAVLAVVLPAIAAFVLIGLAVVLAAIGLVALIAGANR